MQVVNRAGVTVDGAEVLVGLSGRASVVSAGGNMVSLATGGVVAAGGGN